MSDIFAYWLVLSLNYLLLSSGLTLTIGIMRVVNLAHGHFFMAGAFVFLILFEEIRIPYIVALLVTLAIIGALGMLIEAKLYRPLGGRIEPSIVCMSGVLLILEGVALIFFGADFRNIRPLVDGSVNLAGVALSTERIAVAFFALSAMVGLFVFLRYTRLGRSMRATAQDREAASLMGVNVNVISSLSMGIGTALAALAGIQISAVYYISPFVGVGALVTSILIVTMGGMGSLFGAVLAAFIIGLCDSFGAAFLGRYSHLVSFGTVMIILLLKPSGLLGVPFEIKR